MVPVMERFLGRSKDVNQALVATAEQAPREADLAFDALYRSSRVYVYAYVAGLSNAEIATVVGVSESNAGTRLHRAVTKLREACDGAI